MLSAVAARKARLAQSRQNRPTTPPSPVIPPEPKSSIQASSKRKPSVLVGNANKRKKQPNSKASSAQPLRYFAQNDATRAQDDMIVVEEHDSDTSASHPSEVDELLRVQAPVTRRKTSRRTRAWSPSAPLPDSSDEEGAYTGEDEPLVLDVSISPSIVPPPTEAPSVLSTFQPIPDRNTFDLSSAAGNPQRTTVLLLNSPETVALLGTYTVRVLRGAITLAGVTLTPSPTVHPVFAPRSSPIPVIECLPTQSFSSASHEAIELPSHVLDAAKQYDATILLQEMQTGIEGLGKVCRTFDGFFAPSRWNRGQTRFDIALDNVYFLTHRTSDISPLVIPSSWDDAISRIAHDTRDGNVLGSHRHINLVRGPKNVGKSTFARLLVNRLLSRYRRVAYLECDLGQSEFTASGIVSLNVVEQPIFGPPFSHPSIPYASHYIGANSPRTSPSHYLDSIQALIQLYNMDVHDATLDEEEASESGDDHIVSTIPLVINTMGWTKGLGADLSRKIEEIVEPSDVYSFEELSLDEGVSSGILNHPPGESSVCGGPAIHTVTSVPPSPSTSQHTAADVRSITMLSYFHAVFPDTPPTSSYASSVASAWDTSLPLCAQPPYQVDCAAAFERLVLYGAGMEDVVSSELPRALNGAVVALVSCDQGTLDSMPKATDDTDSCLLPYEQGGAPPSPHTSKCIGLALVRAISPDPSSSSYIQLLTPIPPHLLDCARVLVMGEVQLPIWGMLDFRTLDDDGDIAGYERGKVPYLRWGKGEGAGGERRRVRRNLMRRGQM